MPSLQSWYWHFLENYVYAEPLPPPRTRPADKPMQVLCLGLPRSGSESLQHALLTLGYDHTYHGWDMLFEQPHQRIRWTRLARRKFFGADNSGDCHISAAEFDEVLGHSMAVTDAAGSAFARELVQAYPDAKVVLNVRRDLDAWHRSACEALVDRVERSWAIFIISWFCADMFWMTHLYYRFLWPGVFRCLDGRTATGITRNGKWVYREHCDFVRGMVGKENLLEWSVEDGWEPLCEFLGKEVPKDTPFPHTNTAAGGHAEKVKELQGRQIHTVIRNMILTTAGCTVTLLTLWRLWQTS